MSLLFFILFNYAFCAQETIQERMVRLSVKEYHQSAPCACPFDTASDGSSCGGRSAYSKRLGKYPFNLPPFCYPETITPDDIKRFGERYK